MAVLRKIYITQYIYALLLFGLGLTLVINPEINLKVVGYLLGSFLLACGVLSVITFSVYDAVENVVLATGICQIVLGVLEMCFCKYFATITAMPIVLALLVLLTSLSRIHDVLEYRNGGRKRQASRYWWVYMIYCVVGLVAGMILLNPVYTIKDFLTLFGALIMVLAVINIIASIFVSLDAPRLSLRMKKDA